MCKSTFTTRFAFERHDINKHQGRENMLLRKLKNELTIRIGSDSVITKQEKEREKYMRRKMMRIDATPNLPGRPRNLKHVCKHC